MTMSIIQQVSSLSPHAWPSDMRLYNSSSNSFTTGLDQTNTGNSTGSYHNNVSELQLIDCLSNLATGSSHNYQRMIVEEETTELKLHNGAKQQQTTDGSSAASDANGTSTHAEMMILGDLSGHGQTNPTHRYNDLYKLQSVQSQTSSVSPPTSSPPSTTTSAKLCFTSLDSASADSKITGPIGTFFKSSSSSINNVSSVASNTVNKVLEINNNSASSAGGIYESFNHRYGDHHRSSSLANLTAYQHSPQHHPGKMTTLIYSQDPAQGYGGNETSFTYYDYPGGGHYNSHGSGDIDLDFDTVCANGNMLECDVDQVIRHELDVDGSLDFGLTSAGTNADSTTSSTPTTSCSQNTYPILHSTKQQIAEPHLKSTTLSTMKSNFGQRPQTFCDVNQPAPNIQDTSVTLSGNNSICSNTRKLTTLNNNEYHDKAPKNLENVRPFSPSSLGSHSTSSAESLCPNAVTNGPYLPSHYHSTSHYLANPTTAAAVVVAAAETVVNVSVTSPVTISGNHNHQQPVASRSWVH